MSGPARVLVVCTANVCRSPMAEGLLRQHFDRIGADVVVTSAGTRGGQLPVDPEAVAALQSLGVDIRPHQSRAINRQLLDTDGADLIVTMTRDHLRTIATMGRTLFHRTFTLPELARRSTDSSRDMPTDLAGWIEALGEGRKPSLLLGADPIDDVSDPYGQGAAEVRRTAAELDRLVQTIVKLAPWPRHAR